MQFKQLKQLTSFLIAASALSTSADSLNGLENFIRNTKAAHADFTQVVTYPARDGQSARAKTSSGHFAFIRPGRFRFDYLKPFAQTIVADGQTLWLYDVDLNQVTARKQAQALASTPAALIASATDLTALQADFTLSAQADQEGMEWVLATPKAKDSPLQSVRVGLRAGELAALEILDTFGQKSSLRFSGFTPQAPDPSHFQFKPPAGADVVRQ
ncbi:MAG: outer membrane lipoprotein chaperone LolA [Rhodoferax sp.]|nr:outer membrane lipoprotein chaperone LolA [Rhodoferax sp.]